MTLIDKVNQDLDMEFDTLDRDDVVTRAWAMIIMGLDERYYGWVGCALNLLNLLGETGVHPDMRARWDEYIEHTQGRKRN